MKQKQIFNLALLVALVPLIVKILTAVASWIGEYKAIKETVTRPAVVNVESQTEIV